MNLPTPEETFLFTTGAVIFYSRLMLVVFSLMWLWTDGAVSGTFMVASMVAHFWANLRLIAYDRIKRWGS